MVFILFIQQVTKSMEVLMENVRAHADLYPEALFSLVLKKCWPRGQKSFKSLKVEIIMILCINKGLATGRWHQNLATDKQRKLPWIPRMFSSLNSINRWFYFIFFKDARKQDIHMEGK